MKYKTLKRLHADASRRERQTKEVRIDHKTVIIVNCNIPDEEAKVNFLLKLQERDRRHFTLNDRTRNAITKTREE